MGVIAVLCERAGEGASALSAQITGYSITTFGASEQKGRWSISGFSVSSANDINHFDFLEASAISALNSFRTSIVTKRAGALCRKGPGLASLC